MDPQQMELFVVNFCLFVNKENHLDFIVCHVTAIFVKKDK